MTGNPDRAAFEEPPDLDAEDHAILDHILDAMGAAEDIRSKTRRAEAGRDRTPYVPPPRTPPPRRH